MLLIFTLVIATFDYPVIDFSSYSRRYCALYHDSFKCFGNFGFEVVDMELLTDTTTTVSGYQNAREIAVGDAITCVRDDDGVWCVGPLASAYNFSDLKEIQQIISVGRSKICAHDGQTLICIDPTAKGKTLQHYKLGSIQRGILCGYEVGELFCYSDGSRIVRFNLLTGEGQELLKGLDKPTSFSSYQESLCVKDIRGYHCQGEVVTLLPDNYSSLDDIQISNSVVCWTKNQKLDCRVEEDRVSDFDLTTPPSFQRVDRFWLSQANNVCAISKGNFQCWGGTKYEPIDSPRAIRKADWISTSEAISFAIEDGRVYSWGQTQAYLDTSIANNETTTPPERIPWKGQPAEKKSGEVYF